MTFASTPVAIALGANMGSARQTIGQALRGLADFIDGLVASSLYVSAPMYKTDQPDFFNAVAVGSTTFGPFDLLCCCRALEVELGRVPGERNGPRAIDVDVLSFGVLQLDSDRLVLPHPRAQERRFVMEPWAEADPEATFPDGRRILDWRQDQALLRQSVRRVSDAPIPVPGR